MPIISGKQARNPWQQASRIFSISPSQSFLKVLVDALMDGRLVEGFSPEQDPLALSSTTIFVPSRRAARALAAAFVERFDGANAVLLPKIRTLGDVSDEEFGLEPEAGEFGSLAEAINPLDRKLELANLVHKWADTIGENTRKLYGDEDILIPSSRADALRLADDLSKLMSQIAQEEIDWEDILKIVPDHYANWWQLTSEFLKIIAKYWPQHLAAQGLLDPAERNARLLDLRATRFETKGSEGPVIIAGSTGSVPSTQRLLKAVLKLDQGAVILPGLDDTLSDEEWHKLSSTKPVDDPAIETHAQFGLASLLRQLGIDRRNVKELKPGTAKECRKLVSMALIPADFTSNWIGQKTTFDATDVEQSLSHISLVDAGNERSETLAIAIAMREVLETEGKTAALVTPDRNLARRVSAELRRFGVEVDDSGGTPLANSKPAIFLRQIVEAAFGASRNSTLAALLKNRLCFAGETPENAIGFGQQIELAGLRGAINPARIGQLQADLVRRRQEFEEASHVPLPVQRITDDGWNAILGHAQKLDEIFVPLLAFKDRETAFPIADISHALEIALKELARDAEGNSMLLELEGGRELQELLSGLVETQSASFRIEWQDIPAIIDALLAGINTRPQGNTHPRLHIFGPLEVRLLEFDRVILGGLNEGTWPQSVRNDPFINRSMRHELGMASPERRTGLSAHDFQQLMGKPEIILSRASRVDKAPTVMSRWLQRLGALVGENQNAKLVKRGAAYLNMAEALDQTEQNPQRIQRPCPTPPVSVRPVRMAVTDIETWIRDPYAIYAKRILGLQPLAPLEREPDAMLKGTLYHRIMQYYVESDPLKMAVPERQNLINAIAEEVIRDENLAPDLSRIWLLRWQEIAKPYIAWEESHHQAKAVQDTLCELQGETLLCDGSFTLTARADRIEQHADGTLFLVDYKTGNNPSARQARTLSPQLALEGLIARNGGFDMLDACPVFDLVYMRLRRDNGFKAESISTKDHTTDQIIQDAENELLKLIKGFRFEHQGYISRRVPFKEGDISGDYDHLARTREWSFGEDDSDG